MVMWNRRHIHLQQQLADYQTLLRGDILPVCAAVSLQMKSLCRQASNSPEPTMEEVKLSLSVPAL